MKRPALNLFRICACALGFMLTACIPQSQAHKQKKKVYGLIYEDATGQHYVRSHQGDGFVYWMFNDSSDTSSPTSSSRQPNNSSSLSKGTFSSGGWSRVSSLPSGLKATDKVIEEKEGKPDQEIKEESEVPDDETVTDNTTEAEANSMDSATESASGSADSDSGSDSGTGGDGGGDGGGD